MHTPRTTSRSHRPKALMVFAAAFVAGAAAAVGINRALDVHLAQSKPQVECEPIFVALRSMPQGTPVTVWDVALRDWPKAMLPMTALRPSDEFEGMILRHPVREGQPLLSVQLAKADVPTPPAAQPPARMAQAIVPPSVPEADLWTSTIQPPKPVPTAVAAAPVSTTTAEPVAPAAPPAEPVAVESAAPIAAVSAPVVGEPTIADPPADAGPPAQPEPTEAVSVVTGPAAPAPTVAAPTEPVAPPVAESKAAVRYLVVPERIAMQADNSFVAPKAALAQAAAIDTTTLPTAKPSAPSKAPTAGGSKSVPPVLQDPGKRRPNAAGQAGKPRPQAAAATREPEQAQRPQGIFGSMFPNLRAGIDAIENELGASRRPQADASGQGAASPQKVQSLTPAQKSARGPSGVAPRSF